MERRDLGRSGVAVTRLGLGATALGGMYAASSDEVARAVVDAAWDAGVRTFDAAPFYGTGLAEQRLGRALAGRPRDEVVLSTKVGRLVVPAPSGAPPAGGEQLFEAPPGAAWVWDFTADGARRSLEGSLERLRTDHVDVVLVHDPDHHEEQAVRGALPALLQMREEGVVRAVGVGANDSALLARWVERSDLDVVLLAGRYTLAEQPALDDLLPAALRTGTPVLLGGVFNSGALARAEPAPGARYEYATATPAVLERVRALAATCREHGTTLPAAALQLALAHPAVAGVVLGMGSPAEVTQDVALLRTAVPAAVWAALRERGLLRADAPVPPG